MFRCCLFQDLCYLSILMFDRILDLAVINQIKKQKNRLQVSIKLYRSKISQSLILDFMHYVYIIIIIFIIIFFFYYLLFFCVCGYFMCLSWLDVVQAARAACGPLLKEPFKQRAWWMLGVLMIFPTLCVTGAQLGHWEGLLRPFCGLAKHRWQLQPADITHIHRLFPKSRHRPAEVDCFSKGLLFKDHAVKHNWTCNQLN